MAEDKSIRVVVKINPSRHPELYEALNEIESSGRAERLRSLALMALSGYGPAHDGSPSDSGGTKSGKAKANASNKERTEESRPAAQPAKALNDEVPAEASKDAEEKEEEDPHKDVRKSVVAGMKNVGF